MFQQIIPAFLVGGLLCVIGQLLMDLTKPAFTPAHVLVTYVTGGAILGALGLYGPLVKFAGAGQVFRFRVLATSCLKGQLKGLEKEGCSGLFPEALRQQP